MTNAKFYRNFVCAGLGALALSYVPLSHAFYAQLTAPAGFTAGAINTYNAAKAGVTASVELGRIAATASLNVGGKAVGIATKLPYAGNAVRVAASLIYLHPAVRTTVKVATLLGLTGLAFDVADGLWKKVDSSATPSDGYAYLVPYFGNKEFSSLSEACAYAASEMTKMNSPSPINAVYVTESCTATRWVAGMRWHTDTQSGYKPADQTLTIQTVQSSCPVGWYKTPAGCVQTPPMVVVPQEQFVEDLSRHPMGPNILPELPFDLPVDVPYIEPIFVPTGNPVKNPNYDPSKPQTGENQPYVQPGVKVDPANDAKNPFQVNVQPTNRPTASPTGSTDSQPITDGTGTATDGTDDKPKEDKDERDLCEKNPDILACQKVDTEVPDDKIPKAERSISFQAENVFGGGSCPANQYARVGAQQYMVADWTTRCDYITSYVKPIAYVITFIIVCGIVARALE